MSFDSKRDYLFCSIFTFFAVVTVFNPAIVRSLKGLCILAAIFVFFSSMTTYIATIEKDSIQYVRKFFSIIVSKRSIHVTSIERTEKIRDTFKFYKKDGKSIHFAIYSPEFIAAVEAFCAQHNIPIEFNLKKNNATTMKSN